MKAKEYAALYRELEQEHGEFEASRRLISAWWGDMVKVSEERRIKSNIAAFGVLDEFDQKWKAFCRLCPSFREDGFHFLVRKFMPVAFEAWVRYKEQLKQRKAGRR